MLYPAQDLKFLLGHQAFFLSGVVSRTGLEISFGASGFLSGAVQELIPSSRSNKKYNLSMVGLVFRIDAS